MTNLIARWIYLQLVGLMNFSIFLMERFLRKSEEYQVAHIGSKEKRSCNLNGIPNMHWIE